MGAGARTQIWQHSCGLCAVTGGLVKWDPGSASWLLLWKLQTACPGGPPPRALSTTNPKIDILKITENKRAARYLPISTKPVLRGEKPVKAE